MSGERRRARAAGQPESPEGSVPLHLRRYSSAAWVEDGDEESVSEDDAVEAMLDGHRRWREARRAWARAHGYDPEAKYGEARGRDWWAFLRACEEP